MMYRFSKGNFATNILALSVLFTQMWLKQGQVQNLMTRVWLSMLNVINTITEKLAAIIPRQTPERFRVGN